GSIAQNGLPGEQPLEVVTENLFQSFLHSEFMRQDDHTLNEDDDVVTAIMLAKANNWEHSKEGNQVPDTNSGAEAKESDSKGLVGFMQPEATEPKPYQNDNELTERTESRSVGLEGLGETVNRGGAKASSRPPPKVTTG